MITHSAIYEGTVRHRRFDPVEREFEYGLNMFYLDLEEIDEVLALHPLYSKRLRGPASFRRSDYLGGKGRPLRRSVCAEVAKQTGWRPDGPVRLLTNLRHWGVLANPVSFYYCFDGNDGTLRAVLVEVTNTPWGDRQSYVLQAGSSPSRVLRGRFDKVMHVSPLMGMDQMHEIWAGTPGETASVHIANHEAGDIIFDATLKLRRRELTRAVMTRQVIRLAPVPFRVLAGIYSQAARASLAGVPFHARPPRESEVPAMSGPGGLPGAGPEGMICPVDHRADSHTDGGNPGHRIL